MSGGSKFPRLCSAATASSMSIIRTAVQRNTLRGQPAEEAVGGVAVVLYGRRGKAAILAQPLLKDCDLCVMRMVLMFGFVEPPQESAAIEFRD